MLALIIAVAVLAGLAQPKDLPDFHSFVTEPRFTAVKINVLQNSNPDLLAPGYIFIAPYRAFQGWGAQIFDTKGDLVWFGGATQKRRTIDVQPCLIGSPNYDHLCYNDAYPVEQVGHSVGLIRSFDNTYAQVGEDFGPVGGLRGPDIHELNTPRSQNGKTILQDVYQVRQINLTEYHGPEEGFVLDGCFQELDVVSREVIFQWCALDHVELHMTYIYLPNSGNYTIPVLSGNGRKNAPWDWFHINAVDRNDAGDYVISSRHTNTIFHIAGSNNQHGFQPGEIIWRLGGKANAFSMEEGLNFSAQHTIRYHSVEPTSMQVYLFDNANEGETKTAEASSGILLDLDTENMRASLVTRFIHPFRISAQDQGNLQMLPNGNGFIGWGHCNYFTEHAPSGEVLYNAQFGGKGDCEADTGDNVFVSSFRAWKYPWKGYPVELPKIAAYAKECSTRIQVYVSWNGATEVANWAFYASNSTDADLASFKHVATLPKSGFETRVELDFSRFIYAAPLDDKGEPLSATTLAKTFVPNPLMECDELRCRKIAEQVEENSIANTCKVGSRVSQMKESLGSLAGSSSTWLVLSVVVLLVAVLWYLAKRLRLAVPAWRRTGWSYTPLAVVTSTLDHQELHDIHDLRPSLDSKKEAES